MHTSHMRSSAAGSSLMTGCLGDSGGCILMPGCLGDSGGCVLTRYRRRAARETSGSTLSWLVGTNGGSTLSWLVGTNSCDDIWSKYGSAAASPKPYNCKIALVESNGAVSSSEQRGDGGEVFSAKWPDEDCGGESASGVPSVKGNKDLGSASKEDDDDRNAIDKERTPCESFLPEVEFRVFLCE